MKNVIAFLVKWLLIFAVASVMIFGVVRLMPSTPVEQWLTSFNLPHTKENVAKVTALMGLDQPLPVQYFAWLRNFFKGDWGLSLISHVSIRDTFMQKLPYSVSIGLSGILISAVLAFFLGYRAALHIGGVCDRLSAALAVFSQSIPSFITSVFIIYFLGVKLRAVKFFTGSVRNAMISAILITAIYQLGGLSRVVRNAFREEMRKSYVRFAISRGFSREYVLYRHASRPVLCTLIGAVIANFAWVFGGSTVLEFAFTIPGVSYFLVDSMQSSDYTVLQTYLLVVVIWMFCVHAVLNLALYALDVRRRA
jgi:peptide/nickel transport system permease protein